MKINIKKIDRRFCLAAASQTLYGRETLENVGLHAREVARHLDQSIPFATTEYCGVIKSSAEAMELVAAVNKDPDITALIVWAHTFSPAQMWTEALQTLRKPLLHLITQYAPAIPYATIDMDHMNEHQTAHGALEFAHGILRAQKTATHILGAWENQATVSRIERWMRAAFAAQATRNLVIARFGGKMRNVAVTDGDQSRAQTQFGWTIHDHDVGELVRAAASVSSAEIRRRLEQIREAFDSQEGADAAWESVVAYQVRLLAAMERLLEEWGADAFTTNFEALEGIDQLPALAPQLLMQQGYGFGPEGDWKTAGTLRLCKLMLGDSTNAVTFTEPYVYDLERGLILGSHMAEVCPSAAIAGVKPRIEVHPLGIGGKNPPARLVFDVTTGDAMNFCIIDTGAGFRLVANPVECVEAPEATPRLPVAKAYWKPRPGLSKSVESWAKAGGSHHSMLAFGVDAGDIETLGGLLGISDIVVIQ